MFKLIHNNRKGVTLVELMVCVVVLGLVIPIAGNILYNLTNLNNRAIDRWDVQAAVRLACGDFENNKDGLTNAFQVDLLYDPVIEGGVTLDRATGNITWKNGAASSKVMLKEGIDIVTDEHKSNVFTYIFSAKTWDTDGAYLGELLYMRSYGDNRSHLLLNDYGMGEIPVSVTFSVGSTKDLVAEDGSDPFYTKNTITMHFRSGKEDIEYGYDTSFAIININPDTRPINYSGGKLVAELGWLGTDSKTPIAYVAGWDNYNLNYKNGSLTTDNGFPTAITAQDGTTYYETGYVNAAGERAVIEETFQMKYKDTDGNTQTVEAPVIAREGNVLRYKSPTAEKTHGEAEEKGAPTNVASCLTGFAMMGSNMRDEVLGNIRMFRDNVLRGTEFGDWFIHQYYYVWSPFLIEHTAFLKPVYQAILIPVSYVCEIIAKL